MAFFGDGEGGAAADVADGGELEGTGVDGDGRAGGVEATDDEGAAVDGEAAGEGVGSGEGPGAGAFLEDVHAGTAAGVEDAATDLTGGGATEAEVADAGEVAGDVPAQEQVAALGGDEVVRAAGGEADVAGPGVVVADVDDVGRVDGGALSCFEGDVLGGEGDAAGDFEPAGVGDVAGDAGALGGGAQGVGDGDADGAVLDAGFALVVVGVVGDEEGAGTLAGDAAEAGDLAGHIDVVVAAEVVGAGVDAGAIAGAEAPGEDDVAVGGGGGSGARGDEGVEGLGVGAVVGDAAALEAGRAQGDLIRAVKDERAGGLIEGERVGEFTGVDVDDRVELGGAGEDQVVGLLVGAVIELRSDVIDPVGGGGDVGVGATTVPGEGAGVRTTGQTRNSPERRQRGQIDLPLRCHVMPPDGWIQIETTKTATLQIACPT